jgi:putative transposase
LAQGASSGFVQDPGEYSFCYYGSSVMPRRALIYVPDLSVHVFARGINGGAIVRDDHDRQRLLRNIIDPARDQGIEINAFALMSTHYHLIMTPPSKSSLAKAMKRTGGRHTRHFNRKYGRTGTLWNERYGAALLDDERYWYNCLRYVDLNPFRAHIVAAPGDSPWCSYGFHAHGDPCDWLTPHPLYIKLGATAKARQDAYRALCALPLTDEELEAQRHPPRAVETKLPAGV